MASLAKYFFVKSSVLGEHAREQMRMVSYVFFFKLYIICPKAILTTREKSQPLSKNLNPPPP